MIKFIHFIRCSLITTIIISIIFLAGCTCLRKPLPFKPMLVQERQTALQQITDWNLSGAISITCNKKRDIVRFQWTQKQNDYTINLSGPLNLNSVRIIGNANGVELWRTKKKCIQASTPEQLTYEQLGWRLPVSNIGYWILARSAPGKVDSKSFDQYGHLIALKQDGWLIYYSDFQSYPQKNIDLPRIIEIKNERLAIKIKVAKHGLG